MRKISGVFSSRVCVGRAGRGGVGMGVTKEHLSFLVRGEITAVNHRVIKRRR